MATTAFSKQDTVLLQRHLNEILEGEAFRGSPRSGQFLKYVVEQALAGRTETLKERVIGVELFGREASYDTGEDAIVRVTASEVRKRLLQHYGRYGDASPIHIDLGRGSYVPSFSVRPLEKDDRTPRQVLESPQLARLEASATLIAEQGSRHPVADPDLTSRTIAGRTPFNWKIPLFILLLAAVNLAVWLGIWRPRHVRVQSVPVLPWSTVLGAGRSLQIITSDPDLAEIQQYLGIRIPLSDYANHRVIADLDNNSLPQVRHVLDITMRQPKAAEVDSQITARIAALAQSSGPRVIVRAARDLQFADLHTDGNFILLGSPLSDPWAQVYEDQLDFRFVFDEKLGQEIVRNVHPAKGEAGEYIPTALGGATGRSYATIAFVNNPNQNGQVILLAGADAEGTEAAGRLLTDPSRLSAALTACGISSGVRPRHFELLLALNTMAGVPSESHVEACHLLQSPGTSP